MRVALTLRSLRLDPSRWSCFADFQCKPTFSLSLLEPTISDGHVRQSHFRDYSPIRPPSRLRRFAVFQSISQRSLGISRRPTFELRNKQSGKMARYWPQNTCSLPFHGLMWSFGGVCGSADTTDSRPAISPLMPPGGLSRPPLLPVRCRTPVPRVGGRALSDQLDLFHPRSLLA